jgi:hypothetical protein
MSTPYTNYNIFALSGDPTTSDMDVCSKLGLDPTLAGTPQINDAAIKKMHEQNYKGYIERGLPEDVAQKQADKAANDARKQVQQLMAKRHK